MSVPYRPTSHEGLVHDRIDSFAYDWEQVGNPLVGPRFPFKIYAPRTVEEVIRAVREARTLGERLVVRSKGHSSNDLVFNEGGAILYTAGLNRIVSLDADTLLATVEAGIISADLDALLAQKGLGLPVIGDHDDITVGGFASVGGIGPASFRNGMFVDTVTAIDVVTAEGELVHYTREGHLPWMNAALCGLGRGGIIVQLTVRLIRVRKDETLLENTRHNFTKFEEFLADSTRIMSDPADAFMIRGLWVDAGKLTAGQMSVYRETAPSGWKRLVDRASYAYLYGLGRRQGTRPRLVDLAAKLLGLVGILYAPRYATIRHVEFFSDKILDSSVGDPVRWFMFLVPMEGYAALAREAYELTRTFRDEHGCFTQISQLVKAVRSPYLSPDQPDRLFCELNFSMGTKPALFTPGLVARYVDAFDQLALKHGAYRYMHTRTGKDPALLNAIDPGARWNPYPGAPNGL